MSGLLTFGVKYERGRISLRFRKVTVPFSSPVAIQWSSGESAMDSAALAWSITVPICFSVAVSQKDSDLCAMMAANLWLCDRTIE